MADAKIPEIRRGGWRRGGCWGGAAPRLWQAAGFAGSEQETDVPLGLRIVPFAGVHVTDVSRLVDEIVRRPVVVRVRLPGPVAVVESDRVPDAEALDGGADVAEGVFEC